MPKTRVLCFVIGLTLLVAAGVLAQQTTTTIEQKEVEIVYVTGNTAVFIMDGKVMQREMPPNWMATVDGKQVPLSALVPGQKLMVERTTTTTEYPATKVVTIRNGEFWYASGNTMFYRENNETKKAEIPADFKFMVNGKPVGLQEMRKGSILTATIITKTGSSSVSTAELAASGAAPVPPAPAPVVAPAPAPAPAPELPKTASQLPLLGLAGVLLLALGAGLALVRRFVL